MKQSSISLFCYVASNWWIHSTDHTLQCHNTHTTVKS